MRKKTPEAEAWGGSSLFCHNKQDSGYSHAHCFGTEIGLCLLLMVGRGTGLQCLSLRFLVCAMGMIVATVSQVWCVHGWGFGKAPGVVPDAQDMLRGRQLSESVMRQVPVATIIKKVRPEVRALRTHSFLLFS